jgi:hypothetical protein
MSTNELLTDVELQAAFESCTLPRAAWNHRAHVRMAFVYASRQPLASALAQMRQGIQAYNASQQVPEALDRGYHETMTVAFMRLVHDGLTRNGPFPDSESFCDRHPELLDRFVLRKFYSRKRIVTLEAKQRFVEPDLAELPGSP